MHFLQRQIRLCSSRIAQPLENAVDFDENNIKVIDIPKIALQTQSQPIQHEPDNGHLFKVSNIDTSKNPSKNSIITTIQPLLSTIFLENQVHYFRSADQRLIINK